MVAATPGASLEAMWTTTNSLRGIWDRKSHNNKICNSKCHNIMIHKTLIPSHSNQESSWGINQGFLLDKVVILEDSKHHRFISLRKSSNSSHRFRQSSWWIVIRGPTLPNLCIAFQPTQKEQVVSMQMLWQVAPRIMEATMLLMLLPATHRSTWMELEIGLILKVSASTLQEHTSTTTACMIRMLSPRLLEKTFCKHLAQDITLTPTTQ